MEIYEVHNGMHHISTNKFLLDVKLIHKYLSEESYWAKDIPLQVVETAIEHSLCFGLFLSDIPTSNYKQIGFARLVTDKATFAYLADVFILNEHRGKGLSKWLMQTIHAHSELQNLRRWMLVTKDAQGLYKQFGWTQIPAEQTDRYMIKHTPEIYQLQQQ